MGTKKNKANSTFKRLEDKVAEPVELYAIEQPDLKTVDDVLDWLRGDCIEWLRAAAMVVTDGGSRTVAAQIIEDVGNLIEMAVDAIRTGEVREAQDCAYDLWKNFAAEAQSLLDNAADNIHADLAGAVRAARLLVGASLRGSPTDAGCEYDRAGGSA